MHTKEPWRITAGLCPGYISSSGDGYVRIHTPFREQAWTGDEEAQANARRIVACVNACAGISTEFLEHGLLGTKTNRDVWKHKLEQQRDELLAALKRFADFDGKYGGGEPMDAVDYRFNVENLQKAARAAIAKVKGQ